MNRLLLLIIIIITPRFLWGQLNGEYCHSDGFGVECIIFKELNKFEYRYIACLSGKKGNGSYILKNGQLNLFFESSPNNKIPDNHTIATDTTSDSIEIKIQVLDHESIPSFVCKCMASKFEK